MKWTKLAFIAILAASVLTACGKDKEQQVQQDQLPVQDEIADQTEAVEVAAEKPQEVQTDNSFPVPITFENKKVKLEELPEATQAAIKWVYDYFNTEDIQTEDEFYEMMKAKYYPDREVPSEEEMTVSKEVFLIAGYGTEMLPAFTPGQVVEGFEVWKEVPVGLNIKVPMYVKLKNKENMHAIAISYATDVNRVSGADTQFPMPLD